MVDLEKEKVKATIDSNVQGLHRLKFTPDGKTVCIVSVKTDLATRKEINRINIGRPDGITSVIVK